MQRQVIKITVVRIAEEIYKRVTDSIDCHDEKYKDILPLTLYMVFPQVFHNPVESLWKSPDNGWERVGNHKSKQKPSNIITTFNIRK